MSSEQLRRRTGASQGTLRRARALLSERGVPIAYQAAARKWQLTDPDYEDPLLDPRTKDVTVVVLGAALLDPFLDEDGRRRVRSALEAVRTAAGPTAPPDGWPLGPAVRSAVTMRTTVDPGMLLRVLQQVQRGVIRLSYASPWTERHQQHVVEPWVVQLVDGAMYLHGYSRKRRSSRTFHLGFVSSVVVMPRMKPEHSVGNTEVFGGLHSGYGIDEDHPAVATIRFRGPVARWLSKIEWHPRQVDRGPDHKGVLERSVPYRSRREFARKLLSYADAIASIEPEDLRSEVVAAVDKLRSSIAMPKIKHAE